MAPKCIRVRPGGQGGSSSVQPKGPLKSGSEFIKSKTICSRSVKRRLKNYCGWFHFDKSQRFCWVALEMTFMKWRGKWSEFSMKLSNSIWWI